MAESGPLRFVLYFLVGGTLISMISLLSSLGKPQLAAFLGIIPSTTLLTFVFTYWESGSSGTISYARSMILFTPAWLLYVGCVILLLPKLGLYKTLAAGVAIFFAASLLTNFFLKWSDIKM